MKVEKKELKNAERDLKKLQQSEVYSNYYEFQQVLGEGAMAITGRGNGGSATLAC